MKMQKLVACVLLLLAGPALAHPQHQTQRGSLSLAAVLAKPESKPAVPAVKESHTAAKPVLTKPGAQAAVLAAHKAKSEFVPNTNPILVPESDKLFFGKDYPTDERPAPDTYSKFAYPFPNVQHPDEYDKDYVKDENGDNGEWKTQTDYDFARADLKKQAKEREEARKRYEEEHGQVAGADAAAADADEEWRRAHDEAAAATEAKKSEDGKAVPSDNSTEPYTTGVDGDSSVKELEKALAEAEANYAKEQEEFKKCQQELEDAKAELDRLKALQASTALHAAELKTQRGKEIQQKHIEHDKMIAQKRADLAKEKAAAAAVAAEANKKLAEALKKKQAADKKLAKEKAEDEASKKALDKQDAELKKAEEDLENAAKKLRKGGKTGDPSPLNAILHSGAVQGSVMTPMFLALTVAIARVLC